MKRVAFFIRTILPENLVQLLFLCGSVLLYVSSQLRWWPVGLGHFDQHSLILSLWHLNGLGDLGRSWVRVIWAADALLEIAGSAGLFLCLWPGRRRIRNVVLFVCAPALWAVGAICVQLYLHSTNFVGSVLDKPENGQRNIGLTLLWLWQLQGLRFAALGLLCVVIFLFLGPRGTSSLPIALPARSISAAGDDVVGRRVWGFIWFSCTYAFVVYRLAFTPIAVLYVLGVDPIKSAGWNWLVYAQGWVGAAAFAGVAAWAIGSDRWVEFRKFVALPEPRFAGAAVLIAVAAWAAAPLMTYAYDRFAWANPGRTMGEPPVIAGYFTVPSIASIAIYIVPAFFEEVIYRGYLQPRFVNRYGLLRGLVLVGIFWGAFHFHSGFYAGSDSWVWLVFLWRPALCIVHSLVFGWFTIRSGSILPAALLHGLYNAGISDHLVTHPLPWTVLRIAIWAAIAYVLFRYWPPIVSEDSVSRAIPTSEVAL